jgi:hypothetical protein
MWHQKKASESRKGENKTKVSSYKRRNKKGEKTRDVPAYYR